MLSVAESRIFVFAHFFSGFLVFSLFRIPGILHLYLEYLNSTSWTKNEGSVAATGLRTWRFNNVDTSAIRQHTEDVTV